MQEKYLGDTPDFGKYALLRALCNTQTGLRLGVNWYLTIGSEVDKSDNNDGNKRHHATNPNNYKPIDPDLWERLNHFQQEKQRSLSLLEASGVLPDDTLYHSEQLSLASIKGKDNKLSERLKWVESGLSKLEPADLVFVDPDNGFQSLTKRHHKRGPKFTYYDEIKSYINRNQTVVAIQFMGRQVGGVPALSARIKRDLKSKLRINEDIHILKNRAGKSILYFIIPSQQHSALISNSLDTFLDGPASRIFERVNGPYELTVESDDIEQKSRNEHLEQLIKDFEREQTIQDVGSWLINDTLDPLPPKHIEVLCKWLETQNGLTIKQNRRGNSHSDTRNAFHYITRMHRDTGMSIEAACNLVAEQLSLEIDIADFRRMYDRARTPETRLLNDAVSTTGAFSNVKTPKPKVTKSLHRFKNSKKDQKED